MANDYTRRWKTFQSWNGREAHEERPEGAEPYTVWHAARLAEWKEHSGWKRTPGWDFPVLMHESDHEAFDTWLESRLPELAREVRK